MTYIELKLEVMPGNKIIIPGCEPTSALSSDTLSRSLQCTESSLDLDIALNAIPGSRIDYMFNTGGIRKKFFVLPPKDTTCPCSENIDYFGILKGLSNRTVETEDYSGCNIIDQGFCPVDGYQNIAAPDQSPYIDERSGYFGSGVLTKPPVWNGGT